MKERAILALAALLACPVAGIGQEDPGYRLDADRLVVETEAHWRAWEAEEGVLDIAADGALRPRFLRRGTNAVLDASAFQYRSEGDTLQGGIRQAGSDAAGAPNLIDGDLSTFWEPDLSAGTARGAVEIDLGRATVVRRVDLRFVAAGLGDPFLKFRVLVSDGRTTFTAARQREYYRIGLVTDPNKEQRAFSFEVRPQRPTPAEVEGAVVQFVRVEALGSDGPRGRQVEAAAYEALPADERGAVDFFRVTTAGRQIRVEREVYEALPAVEQGQVRYYRRERPRLAEVEVWALGDEAVRLTRKPRGIGTPVDPQRRLQRYSDGLFDTFVATREYNAVRDENQIEVDLGAQYWLDRVRLLSAAEPPPAYQVRISDGRVDPTGRRVWQRFDERQNAAGFFQLEERFPLQAVRFIEMRRIRVAGGGRVAGNLSEIQGYGEGYVPEVVLRSGLMRLERPRLIAGVDWQGDLPPDARVEVRTRSGDQLLEVPHYFGVSGAEITRTAWLRIREERRPPVVIEELPGPDWSGWSAPYTRPGEAFKSSNPRRYVQAELRLVSRRPLAAATIRRLQLPFVPPLADLAVAEVHPRSGVQPGRQQAFALYLRPVFGPGNPGFDRLLLRSSSEAPMSLAWVRRGSQTAHRLGAATELGPGEVEIMQQADGTLELAFAEPVRQGGELIAVGFETEVFLSSTLFELEMTRQTRPGLVQRATAGEAFGGVDSQSLAVLADLRDRPLLGPVRIDPPVLTPNGDGVNDRVEVTAEIFIVEGSKRLQAGVFDLGGRRVRDLARIRRQASGRVSLEWDGRGADGRLVAPGIYVLRLGFATDNGVGARAMRLLRVAY